MTTFIKAGLWTKKKEGYKGELNLDQFVASKTPTASYKVYTALLTQTGGDFLDQLDYSTPTQNVTKGVTYNIGQSDVGADFTNVGAPNNNVGTSFIAINNEIPKSWGESQGSALIFNTGAPVATVLENTIGNLWFTYISNGTCNVNSDALFTDNKTWCSATLSNYNYDSSNVMLGKIDENTVEMITLLPGDSRFDGSDTSIEIRVYN
jgi:hypothetical protein